ncbi:hypothetical protein Ciccas_003635 [Cichlidogyrus casuarinus]|uniref:Uncharacterized protein n=1 Tax=Cichlidogyrus casuarinus TaxID=1844966 RepID=A0ABD2QDW6_9PLAT
MILHCSARVLTAQQVSALVDCIDVELSREGGDCASVLYLLHAVLTQRLRDPRDPLTKTKVKEGTDFFGLSGTLDLNRLAEKLVIKPVTKQEPEQGMRLSDLVTNRVHHLTLQAPHTSVRRIARKCLIAYLINYPITTKDLHRILETFLVHLQVANTPTQLRESAVQFLRDFVRELTPKRLCESELDETILLTVATSIQRETHATLRLKMVNLLRMLFQALPDGRALQRFEEYLVPFLQARTLSKMSVRLLALQLIPAVLDTHQTLAVSARYEQLFKILLTSVIPQTITRVKMLRFTHPHLFRQQRDALPDQDQENEFGTDQEWLSDIRDARLATQMQADDLEEEQKSDWEEENETEDEMEDQSEYQIDDVMKDACLALDDKKPEMQSSVSHASDCV